MSAAQGFSFLLQKMRQGDKEAEAKLVQENLPLAAAIVRRYSNCGLAREDLMQLASLGLVKALRRFEEERGLCFSTYAVPLIAGEIKRFLRDDGLIKFSREAKSLSLRIEYLRRERGDLTVEELSDLLKESPQDIAVAIASREGALSLDAPSEEDGPSLWDFLPDKGEGTEALALRRVMMRELLDALPEREKLVLYLRYFKNLTQAAVAEKLQVSQVQVSRIEKKALLALRSRAEDT